MAEPMKSPMVNPSDSGRALLGRTMVVKGDLTGNEDLLIAGQFEGTVNVQGHSLTIGPEGKVKAEIQAARVVIYGSVHGNINVQERVEIYKSGQVVGDLIAPGISIEDGAYFKGKIEILREGAREPEHPDWFRTLSNRQPHLRVRRAKLSAWRSIIGGHGGSTALHFRCRINLVRVIDDLDVGSKAVACPGRVSQSF